MRVEPRYYWEVVEPEDDEPPTGLHRLHLDGETAEMEDPEIAVLYMNTVSYLMNLYPSGDDIPVPLRTALPLQVKSLWEWLGITLEPNDDPRLRCINVQTVLLESWLAKRPDSLFDSTILLGGAIELLRARAAAVPLIKEVVQSAVHDVNSRTPNVARDYARLYGTVNALLVDAERQSTEPDFAELTDALEMGLQQVMTEAERTIAAVISKFTNSFIDAVDHKFEASQRLAEWTIAQLKAQHEAAPDKPVRLTAEMDHDTTYAIHSFVYETLMQISEENDLRFLVVTGPKTGLVTLPDHHGAGGRPLGLFPVLRAQCVKD